MDSNTIAASPEAAREQDRHLYILSVIVDETKPDRVRVMAIRVLQASLPESNSLKSIRPEALLKRVLHSWETKWSTFGDVLVRRPPQDLSDVF